MFSGGASGCSLTETTLDSLKKQVRANPKRYRVGGTCEPTPHQRMWGYGPTYNNTAVQYAKVNDVKQAETELLQLLPQDHPHNIQKKSNISPGCSGCVYIVPMQK